MNLFSKQTYIIPLQIVHTQIRRLVILSSEQTSTDTFANSAGPDATARDPPSQQTINDTFANSADSAETAHDLFISAEQYRYLCK